VGNMLAHKNFHVLIGLMERLPGRRLVIAGKKATPYGAAIDREIARRGLGDRVKMRGEVSDGDRQWLYEHCEAFLFPSLAEEFGFPVLEAMQCGKPVFLSRATLPESTGTPAARRYQAATSCRWFVVRLTALNSSEHPAFRAANFTAGCSQMDSHARSSAGVRRQPGKPLARLTR